MSNSTCLIFYFLSDYINLDSIPDLQRSDEYLTIVHVHNQGGENLVNAAGNFFIVYSEAKEKDLKRRFADFVQSYLKVFAIDKMIKKKLKKLFFYENSNGDVSFVKAKYMGITYEVCRKMTQLCAATTNKLVRSDYVMCFPTNSSDSSGNKKMNIYFAYFYDEEIQADNYLHDLQPYFNISYEKEKWNLLQSEKGEKDSSFPVAQISLTGEQLSNFEKKLNSAFKKNANFGTSVNE